MSDQESVVAKYAVRTLDEGMQQANASRAEIQRYTIEIGEMFPPGTHSFRINQPLLLGFNHRNETAKRLRQDSKTANHPNVVDLVRKGIQGAREWGPLPQDAAEFIAGEGNSGHDGAVDGFPHIARTLCQRIQPAFKHWTDSMHVDTDCATEPGDSLPDETEENRAAAGSHAVTTVKGSAYYALFWKFVSPRWGQLFKHQTQFTEYFQINRRLKAFNCQDEVLDDMCAHGDFSAGQMRNDNVVKALLNITQTVEKEYFKTMPGKELTLLVRAWCRFAYVNEKPASDLEYDMSKAFICTTSARTATLVAVMTCPMSGSSVYKTDQAKEIKSFTSHRKEKTESGASGVTGPATEPPRSGSGASKARQSSSPGNAAA